MENEINNQQPEEAPVGQAEAQLATELGSAVNTAAKVGELGHLPGAGPVAMATAPLAAAEGVKTVMDADRSQIDGVTETVEGVNKVAGAAMSFGGPAGAAAGLGLKVGTSLAAEGNNVELGGKNADGRPTKLVDMPGNIGMSINNGVTELTGSRTAGNVAGAVTAGLSSVANGVTAPILGAASYASKGYNWLKNRIAGGAS